MKMVIACELDAQFAKYHAENPDMFKAYVDYGRMIVFINDRISISAITERIRWDTLIRGTGTYKVQNSFRAYYARLLMWRHPEFRGKFELRNIPLDNAPGRDRYDVYTWEINYWGLLK